TVLAGIWREGAYGRSVDLLAAGESPRPWRESTTLVCVLTDAQLTKTQAWLVAPAGGARVGRAGDPPATARGGGGVDAAAAGARAGAGRNRRRRGCRVLRRDRCDGARSAGGGRRGRRGHRRRHPRRRATGDGCAWVPLAARALGRRLTGPLRPGRRSGLRTHR